MNDFKERYLRFMQGRNGTDELYIFMIALYLVLSFLNVFLHSRILYAILFVLLILTFMRFLSKNIYKRQKENVVLLNIIERIKTKNFKRNPYDVKPKKPSKLKKKINMRKTMFKDRKTHVFKKCPGCKAVIRLPKRKGSHNVCCPKCNNNFQVKIR